MRVSLWAPMVEAGSGGDSDPSDSTEIIFKRKRWWPEDTILPLNVLLKTTLE